MSARKPRADSRLKTLPPERQSTIADYARDHSLAETRAWLAADGLKTSEAALSEFLSWLALQRQLARNESTVETLLARLRQQRPDWTPAQIQQVGQSFFSALALEQQDPKGWHLIQQTALKKEQLDLERERIELLKRKADAYDRAQATLNEAKQSKGGITPETLKKIETELRLL